MPCEQGWQVWVIVSLIYLWLVAYSFNIHHIQLQMSTLSCPMIETSITILTNPLFLPFPYVYNDCDTPGSWTSYKLSGRTNRSISASTRYGIPSRICQCGSYPPATLLNSFKDGSATCSGQIYSSITNTREKAPSRPNAGFSGSLLRSKAPLIGINMPVMLSTVRSLGSYRPRGLWKLV